MAGSCSPGAGLRRPPPPGRPGRARRRRPDRRPSGRTPARRVPGPRSSTWPAGCCRRASSTPTSTRSRAGWSGCAATCRSSTPARSTSTRSRRTPPRTPTREWILGGGWAMPAFPGGNPTAADLDAVVPDRPVFLPNRDHHGAWVNSRALGARRHRPGHPRPARRPDRARRRRRPDGHPARGRDVAWSPGSCPRTTGEDYYAALLAGQAYLHSLGVTGWQDAIVGAYAGMDDPGLDVQRAAATATYGRTSSARCGGSGASASSRSPTSSAGAAAMAGGRFRATSVKIMQDGVAENGTAAMLEPYLDRCGHPTDNRGHSFVEAGGAARRRWRRSTPPASRCTCTRSATAACARRSTPSSAPTPRAATTSRTCS